MTLRILHIIDTGGPGGAETVLANIVEGLDAQRFRSRTLVPDRDWLHERLLASGGDVVVVPRGGTPDLPFLRGIVHHIRTWRPHILQTHLLTSAVYGSIAAQLMGNVPLVATFHGEPDVRRDDRLLRLKARILSRRLNRIVYVADHLRKKLETLLGHAPELSRIIHNGLRLHTCPPELDARPSGDGTFRIGLVGNIRPAKDYPNLLEAARHVCHALPRAEFRIAGSGTEADLALLEERKKALGLNGRVEFLGFVRDVADFLCGLDLFVSSSRTEGLPLAMVEATALGRPVVATRCGGNEEVLGTAGVHCLVPAGDPEALAQRIIRALSDRERARQTAEALSTEVRRRFGLQTMLDGYQELYGDLVRRAGHEERTA